MPNQKPYPVCKAIPVKNTSVFVTFEDRHMQVPIFGKLQTRLVTFCMISSSKFPQVFTGMAVMNPYDKLDYQVGQRVALRRAFLSVAQDDYYYKNKNVIDECKRKAGWDSLRRNLYAGALELEEQNGT